MVNAADFLLFWISGSNDYKLSEDSLPLVREGKIVVHVMFRLFEI